MNVMTAAPELPFLLAVHESARRVVHEVKGQCTRLSGLYAESASGCRVAEWQPLSCWPLIAFSFEVGLFGDCEADDISSFCLGVRYGQGGTGSLGGQSESVIAMTGCRCHMIAGGRVLSMTGEASTPMRWTQLFVRLDDMKRWWSRPLFTS